MPRKKVDVPNVAEAEPGLWSNGIRAGDFLFISGQVARPFEGGKTLMGSNEYEQARHEFFSGDFPASTLVEVRPLAGKETLVEIEAMAYLGRK